MKVRSDFTVIRVQERIVFIVDNDNGLSVTNDAEAVVDHLNDIYPSFRVVYRDTDGNWDELVHVDGVFKRYAPYHGELPL